MTTPRSPDAAFAVAVVEERHLADAERLDGPVDLASPSDRASDTAATFTPLSARSLEGVDRRIPVRHEPHQLAQK